MLRDALLACCLAVVLAACRRAPDASPAPRATPAPTPTVTPAPTPSVAPAPAAACTATTGSAFHLRAMATWESSGPEYPAGTRLAVLSVDDDVTRRSTQMYAVRVLADGATGHAFLSARELAADCPAPLREPAEHMACQGRCAAPVEAAHERCLRECTDSGERGSECLDACQDDRFVACMRTQCGDENPPRMW